MSSGPLFCQFCGWQGFSQVAEGSAFTCDRCQNVTYRNSKPAVCAIIVDRRNVLLVSDADPSEFQSWDLPGGFLLYGEAPEDGLKRELKEELGVEIEVGELLTALVDTYGERREFTLNLFYSARFLSASIQLGSEIMDHRWFSVDCLPNMKYRSSLRAISDLFKD